MLKLLRFPVTIQSKALRQKHWLVDAQVLWPGSLPNGVAKPQSVRGKKRPIQPAGIHRSTELPAAIIQLLSGGATMVALVPC